MLHLFSTIVSDSYLNDQHLIKMYTNLFIYLAGLIWTRLSKQGRL